VWVFWRDDGKGEVKSLKDMLDKEVPHEGHVDVPANGGM
jgi:hypothetical protein